MSPIDDQARHAERFRRLVRDSTGIHLGEAKDAMIEARLRSRVVALGLNGVGEYFRHIFDRGGLEAEMPRIIDLITTNKTDFFRERAHFDFLRDHVLSGAGRRGARTGRASFKIWSAAASTGAEAWSAAMVLAEVRNQVPDLDWAILGTDISERVLATARLAIYPEAELLPVSPALRDRYTMVGRGTDGAPLRRIVPELRQKVQFAWLNLMDSSYQVESGLDAIFLRNVLIYFDSPTQTRVIASMARHLKPGGHLFVGHAESMIVRQPGLRQVAPSIFEREAGADLSPQSSALVLSALKTEAHP